MGNRFTSIIRNLALGYCCKSKLVRASGSKRESYPISARLPLSAGSRNPTRSLLQPVRALVGDGGQLDGTLTPVWRNRLQRSKARSGVDLEGTGDTTGGEIWPTCSRHIYKIRRNRTNGNIRENVSVSGFSSRAYRACASRQDYPATTGNKTQTLENGSSRHPLHDKRTPGISVRRPRGGGGGGDAPRGAVSSHISQFRSLTTRVPAVGCSETRDAPRSPPGACHLLLAHDGDRLWPVPIRSLPLPPPSLPSSHLRRR